MKTKAVLTSTAIALVAVAAIAAGSSAAEARDYYGGYAGPGYATACQPIYRQVQWYDNWGRLQSPTNTPDSNARLLQRGPDILLVVGGATMAGGMVRIATGTIGAITKIGGVTNIAATGLSVTFGFGW